MCIKSIVLKFTNSMKEIKEYKFAIVFLVFVFLILKVVLPSRSEVCNDGLNYAKSRGYNGVIVNKYIKPNHASPTIEFKTGNTVRYASYSRDLSGLYDYLQIGDSICKDINSLNVKVFRSEVFKEFVIDHGCDQYNNKK